MSAANAAKHERIKSVLFQQRMFSEAGWEGRACNLQGRNILEYLVEAIEAYLCRHTNPSLLVSEATVEQAQAA